MLKVGDTLRDNYPGMRDRRLTIVEVLSNRVIIRDAEGKRFSYLLRNIYTDGKPRKSGMSLEQVRPFDTGFSPMDGEIA